MTQPLQNSFQLIEVAELDQHLAGAALVGANGHLRAEQIGQFVLQPQHIAIRLGRRLSFGGRSAYCTRRSVSRTDSPFCTTRCAS
jgi:hypothetical protein